MTIGGWIFLLLSLSFVWGLAIFCYVRVLKGKKDIEIPPASLGG